MIHSDKMDDIDTSITNFRDEQQTRQDEIVSEYQTTPIKKQNTTELSNRHSEVESIDAEINLKRKQVTTSVPLNEEDINKDAEAFEALTNDLEDIKIAHSTSFDVKEQCMNIQSEITNDDKEVNVVQKELKKQKSVDPLKDSGSETLQKITSLESLRDKLKNQIGDLIKKRIDVRQSLKMLHRHQKQSIHEYNAVIHKRNHALSEFKAAALYNSTLKEKLESTRKWHPTQDIFYIWHRGPFATINGLRLGIQSPPSATDAFHQHEEEEKRKRILNFSQQQQQEHSPFPSSGATNPSLLSSFFSQPSSSLSQRANKDVITVSWPEINAALGTVALLLHTIQSNPHSNIKFKMYKIYPIGSHSKIVKLGTTPVHYDLYYREDMFQFFARRNFNSALHGLVLCLRDAALEVKRRDPSLQLPFDIVQDGNEDSGGDEGEMKVGGYKVAYLGDGVLWTKVMRYLAVDVKWLIAFLTRHVDL